MKKKLSFMILGMIALFTFAAGETQASVLESNTMPNNNVIHEVIDVHQDDNSIESRLGFRWRCLDCGHVGAWQISYNTASKHAMAHHQRTGHRVMVYGV